MGVNRKKFLTIDERHLDGGISSEFLFQIHGDRKAGKPSSKNEYPFTWSIFHGYLAIRSASYDSQVRGVPESTLSALHLTARNSCQVASKLAS